MQIYTQIIGFDHPRASKTFSLFHFFELEKEKKKEKEEKKLVYDKENIVNSYLINSFNSSIINNVIIKPM